MRRNLVVLVDVPEDSCFELFIIFYSCYVVWQVIPVLYGIWKEAVLVAVFVCLYNLVAVGMIVP